jgi:anti-sigma factor RsiW
MACDAWGQKLDAYVDGELAPSDATAFAAHLKTCLACATDALELTRMKRSVGVAGKRYEPSVQFRNRIAQRVSEKSVWVREPAPGRFWRLIALPAAAFAIVFIAFAFYLNREGARQQPVLSELADLHIATLASANPIDVVSTDRHTVKPWFQGKIPFTFNLPDLQGSDFTLLGGRVSYLAQSPGAQLIFQVRKHEISVFIFQDRGASAGICSQPVQALSFTVESWTQNGLRYFVIGDTGAGDIKNLSNLLRAAR